MTHSENASGTSGQEHSQQVGESINNLGSATADLGKEAQAQVTNLTQQVRDQATGQLMSQKERAVDTLETVALLLHQAGEHAQQQDKALLANYVDKAAQQISTFSDSLAHQDVDQIVQSTKDFARREPMLFVGGALAAGFLGARFLRSSAQQVSQEQSASSQGEGGSQQGGSGETSADTTPMPAYDVDQASTASSDDLLGASSPAPSDVMTPDETGLLEEYETAVLEGDAFEDDIDAATLPDLEDTERAENL